MNPFRKLFFLPIYLLLANFASLTQANDIQPITVNKEKLMAAFILNICKFTDFQSSADKNSTHANFRISVVENDGIFNELSQISAGKKITNQEIEIRSVRQESIDPSEVVVLVPQANRNTQSDLKILKGCHCMTITSEEGMAEAGSIINFFTLNDQLRFEINLKRAKDEGVILSSRLLKLGKLIE